MESIFSINMISEKHPQGGTGDTRMSEEYQRVDRNRDEGSIGIGAMIVFIALILVAAVASTIIIKTAEELQQNAEATSDDTRKEISGKISIIQILVNTTGTTDINSLLVTAKVASGSTDVLVNNIEWLITCGDDTNYGVVTGNLGTDGAWGEAQDGGSGYSDPNAMQLDGTRFAANDELTAGTSFMFEIDLDKSTDGTASNDDEVWDDDGGGALELDEGGQCNTLAGVGETLNLKMIVQEGGTTITEMKIESIVPGKEVI
jgi:archaellin